jgi:2-iminobutanoate/2-iminopropanoate deaminase
MVLKIEPFQPESMNVRISGGKPSYSHVVTVSGSGKIVYTAGQFARDVDGNCVGKGDMRAQMEQTFQNPTSIAGRPGALARAAGVSRKR